MKFPFSRIAAFALGTAIALSLPVLPSDAGDIQRCGLHSVTATSWPVRRTQYAGTGSNVGLSVTLENWSRRPVEVFAAAGTLLNLGTGVQRMMLVDAVSDPRVRQLGLDYGVAMAGEFDSLLDDEYTWRLEPGQTRMVQLNTLCIDLAEHAPASTGTYDPSITEADPSLVGIAQAARKIGISLRAGEKISGITDMDQVVLLMHLDRHRNLDAGVINLAVWAGAGATRADLEARFLTPRLAASTPSEAHRLRLQFGLSIRCARTIMLVAGQDAKGLD